ncbi:hypothetical protein GCM10010172_66600 [Paractinoplanes ferrugineus]|uniref:Uncharacterized protein n=1 Tax=Paractinoplanes ferrugineus TaxID=113564 RepID=A0A919J5W9_9ACTN|nr:hypothetical protein Afe05nite_50190 [Actinoplanes ferrugineus]
MGRPVGQHRRKVKESRLWAGGVRGVRARLTGPIGESGHDFQVKESPAVSWIGVGRAGGVREKRGTAVG